MIDLMNIDPFKEAMAQLDAAASKLGTKNPELKFKLESLRSPEKIIEVSFPVKMDDGKTKIFKGYRVQYNDALGPYKGGIRFHPDVSLPEVKALAFWMTVKCALMGIPIGKRVRKTQPRLRQGGLAGHWALRRCAGAGCEHQSPDHELDGR